MKNGKRMNRIFIMAVTGVPATGKTSFSKTIKKELVKVGKAAALIELNSIVGKYHTYSSKDRFGTRIVNVRRLSLAAKAEIKKQERAGKGILIIVGHLAPELSIKYDIAVVTRFNLKGLVKRMKQRKYPLEKVRDNIVSEAYDYCGMQMHRMCKETYEVETEAEKKALLAYIKALALHKHQKKPKTRELERMKELLALINKNRRLGF